MAAIRKESSHSKPVILCMDYIYYNLHTTITVAELANQVKLTPTYLSSLFKKETGISISDYIRNKRVEAAENMLKYSDYSYLEISNYLAFSSHSHFAKVLKNIQVIHQKNIVQNSLDIIGINHLSLNLQHSFLDFYKI